MNVKKYQKQYYMPPVPCMDWAEKDSRIRVIHKENGGVASARNDALNIVRGDYVGFVDSDDYIELNMFERMNLAINNYSADIVITSYFYNENDIKIATNGFVCKEDCLQKIAMGNYEYGVLWNKLYKKKVILGIKMPSLVCSEDLVYNYFAFKKANSIIFIDEPLYHYCQNEEGTVLSSFSEGAFDAVKAKEIIIENESDNNSLAPYLNRGLISSAFVVLSGCIQNDVFIEKQHRLIEIILSHKSEIIKSSLYSMSEKIKTLLLCISPELYSKIIKRKHKDND